MSKERYEYIKWKSIQWTILLSVAAVALIITDAVDQGLGWILGWLLFGVFSFVKFIKWGRLEDEADFEADREELV